MEFPAISLRKDFLNSPQFNLEAYAFTIINALYWGQINTYPKYPNPVYWLKKYGSDFISLLLHILLHWQCPRCFRG